MAWQINLLIQSTIAITAQQEVIGTLRLEQISAEYKECSMVGLNLFLLISGFCL